MNYTEHVHNAIKGDFQQALRNRAELQEKKRTVIEELADNMIDISQIMEHAKLLGVDLPPAEVADEFREPELPEVREWVQSQAHFSELEMQAALGMSRATAEQWIESLLRREMIKAYGVNTELHGRYFFNKPSGGPKRAPRSAPRPDTAPEAPQRGAPVEGTGDQGYPEHVKRVLPHLKKGSSVEKRGNGHIWFFPPPTDTNVGLDQAALGTWTSSTPKSPDDEHTQLVRRLKEKGIWQA